MALDDQNRTGIAARAFTGGAIAVFVGILLLLMGPEPAPGSPLNPHQMAWLFVAIGVFLLAIGAFARLFLKG